MHICVRICAYTEVAILQSIPFKYYHKIIMKIQTKYKAVAGPFTQLHMPVATFI